MRRAGFPIPTSLVRTEARVGTDPRNVGPGRGFEDNWLCGLDDHIARELEDVVLKDAFASLDASPHLALRWGLRARRCRPGSWRGLAARHSRSARQRTLSRWTRRSVSASTLPRSLVHVHPGRWTKGLSRWTSKRICQDFRHRIVLEHPVRDDPHSGAMRCAQVHRRLRDGATSPGPPRRRVKKQPLAHSSLARGARWPGSGGG